LFLSILVLGGVYLTQRLKTATHTVALGQPLSVKVANINNQSATVYWLTEESTTGSIKIDNKIFLDNRDQSSGESSGRYFTHYVTISNLKPEETYRFAIISEGQVYQENNFQFSTAKTLPNLNKTADFAFGIILDQQQQPLPNALVTLSLTGAANLASLTDKSGFWSIPLSTAYQKDLSGLVNYNDDSQIIEIFVESQPGTSTTVITNTGNDHPVPPIIIGQNYNFSQNPPVSKQQPQDFDWTSPEIIEKMNNTFVPTTIPEEEINSTGKENTININNPEEGATIFTTQPEFSGQGPANQKIKIIIESSKKYEEEITVSGFGSWQWIPPDHLTVGEHTITVEYYDENNILHTIKRSFTVQAASVSPSPTPITPLPTITPSPTPVPATPTLTAQSVTTITPSPTLTPTPTAEITPPAQIVSGSLTPLLTLAILGLGFVYFAFNIRQKKSS
ncbi:MAG: Ig-like domain-containing protein, partial [Candidatus Shapirobacteria bacterium]|nr:Ig-like domain-containing protein [Candidatus Shapirobacteria bacterium]